MSDVEFTYSNWRQLRDPPADWDPLFRGGSGAILVAEVPAYALVAGYVHRFVERGRVLDAGCGEGNLVNYLNLERLSYVGFDVSPAAVACARERFGLGSVFECSIQDFQVEPNQYFNAIVFKGSLPSLEDPLGVIDLYRSYLTADGVIIVALYVNPGERGNSSLLSRFLEEACLKLRYNLIERADAISVTHDRSWRVFVLGR